MDRAFVINKILKSFPIPGVIVANGETLDFQPGNKRMTNELDGDSIQQTMDEGFVIAGTTAPYIPLDGFFNRFLLIFTVVLQQLIADNSVDRMTRCLTRMLFFLMPEVPGWIGDVKP